MFIYFILDPSLFSLPYSFHCLSYSLFDQAYSLWLWLWLWFTVASLLKLTNRVSFVSNSFSTGLTAVSLRSHAKGSVRHKETFTSLSLTPKFYKLLNKWAVLPTGWAFDNHGYGWASGLTSPAITMTELYFTYKLIVWHVGGGHNPGNQLSLIWRLKLSLPLMLHVYLDKQSRE